MCPWKITALHLFERRMKGGEKIGEEGLLGIVEKNAGCGARREGKGGGFLER